MADEQIVDESKTKVEDKPVTDDDLRALKYGKDGVETALAEDEPTEPDKPTEPADDTESEGSDQIVDDTEDAEEKSDATFTKKFPNIKGDTPEEYARNVEIAYENSSAEAIRLKQLADNPAAPDETDDDEDPQPTVDPVQMYVKQQMDKEISSAFETFIKEYPQVREQADYDAFTRRVKVISKSIMEDEGRLAPPAELYNTAAASLGWDKQTVLNDDEKLGTALKDGAAVSKSNSMAKQAPKSKVTDSDISVFKKMNPNSELNDSQIRKELEPHK